MQDFFKKCVSDTYALSWLFLCIYAISFALSIAVTQISLLCFILIMTYALYQAGSVGGKGRYFVDLFTRHKNVARFYAPLAAWFLLTLSCSFFGLDPMHSVVNLIKFSIYFVLPLYVMLMLEHYADRSREMLGQLLILFVLSHGIAGLHTFISAILGYQIKPGVPGPLTESGQFELLFPVIFVLPFFLREAGRIKEYLFSILIIFSACFFGVILLPVKIACLLFVILITLGMALVRKNYFSMKEVLCLLSISLSLSALLFGLKRGPWMSIGIETVVLVTLLYGSRCLLLFLMMIPMGFVPVIQDRIMSMSEHFFIGGGRFDMWKLGVGLIERFPLGLGFGNSDLIRKFDETLPVMHRHMHNNILNIVLECGWLGGAMFFLWLFRTIKMTWPIGRFIRFPLENREWFLLRGALTLSFVGWQIGGLVEYNIGDGEIRLFALVLMGAYLFAMRHTPRGEVSSC